MKNNAQLVSMPSIIGNNMVLQQNTQAPIWGWATAGANVVINASWGQSVNAVANANGKWMTKIQTPVAIPGQAPAYTLTVTSGANIFTFTNILIGEVWLCSGQSNMWFPMNGVYQVVDFANEVAAANYPNIRLFTVPNADAISPVANCGGSWLSCSPKTVSAFSAAAYYFGREIYNNKALNIPVGLICNAYPGSGIQAWIKDSVLRADVDLKTKYIDLNTNTGVYKKPSLLYNALIAPLIPFAIKGVLWYQGEANTTDDGATYTKANLQMVKDWRDSWGRDLSFYAVQITPHFYTTTSTDLGVIQGFFRQAQSDIMSDPKMGVVVTSDLLLNEDERYEAHPKNKKDVGKRLSLWALAKDYGQPIPYLGPLYQSYTVEGNKIRINYKPESIGSGLTTRDGLYIKNFRIAGVDKKFYPAWATIDGNTIVVSSTFVNAPIAVRYAFSDGAMTNLINKEGLPAYQFKTDSWPLWPYIGYVDSPEVTADVENQHLNPFVLFPNPFNDHLSISGLYEGFHKIEIFDIMGRKVKSQTGDNTSKVTVDVSDIAKGVYVLRIIQKDLTTIDFKAVKQ